MTTPSLIEPGLVALDVNLGETKQEVIRALAGIVAGTGRAEADGLARDALEREGKSPTGMPGGFAIPHCRSGAVNTASLGFARLNHPVDFGAKDGAADLVFLIAASENGGADHMKLLTKLARALVKKDFLMQLREARTDDEIVALVRGVVEPDGAMDPSLAPANQSASSGDGNVVPLRGADEPGTAAPAGTGGATAAVVGATGGAAAGTAAGSAVAGTGADGRPSIIAITACPTGIAHTYMAADYLTDAGKEMGVDVVTEPQGSTATDPVTADQIKAATAVIFATDVGVKGRERFAGLPVVESGVKRAINEPKKMIEEALAAAKNPQATRVAGTAGAAAAESGAGAAKSQLGWGKRIQQALMTGVSYMVPFVAAGGLLIALGFLLAGYQVPFVADAVLKGFSLTHLPSYGDLQTMASAKDATFTAAQISDLHHTGLLIYLGSMLFKLGSLAFGFLLPALAGYIGFAMADRPGIVPGFVAGAVAGATGAGFLGALVGGLIAGAVAAWIGGLKAPRWLRGLMPVVIIPLFASLAAGGLLYLFLASPIAWLMTKMNAGLAGMSGSSAVLLGIVLGLMMCFDLGGPVNKAAYLFATTNLAVAATPNASMKIMAAVMAAGMVPPIALAIATTLRPQLFTKVEKENGTACWLLGASFISEGAIPFAAADPLRIIPAMMAGGALTGAMSMAFGAASKAPHGGVFVLFAISHGLMWILSILAGSVLSAALVIVLKSTRRAQKLDPALASR